MARSGLGVATRLAIAQSCVAVVVAMVVLAVGWSSASDRVRADAESRVLGVAGTIAVDPEVIAGVTSSDPTGALEDYTLAVQRRTGVAFITIMSPAGIRYTHPDRAEIGKHFLGDTAPALAGRSFTEEYTGTLGPSVRAVEPIRSDGRIVALVAVGVLTSGLRDALIAELPVLIGIPLAVLVLGLLVSLLLARHLRRITGDRRPEDLARMVDSDDAILHELEEGLLLLDRGGAVVHANDRALELTGGGGGAVPPDVLPALAGPSGDAVLLVDGRVLVISRIPSTAGRTVVILRDATELRRLAGELETMRTLSNALRAQAHEHANRLHTIVALIELGRPQAAAELAVTTVAAGQALAGALMECVQDPVLVALLLGKTSEAEERGTELRVEARDIPEGVDLDPALRADLVTILGNLVDNALDAVQATDPPRRVDVRLAGAGADLVLTVTDTGPGIAADSMAHVFERGYSTKPHEGLGRGVGLALVRAAVSRRGGTVVLDAAEPHGARFEVVVPAILQTAGAER